MRAWREGRLAKNQAGQGEEGMVTQCQVQSGGQLDWDGFTGQCNSHVYFPRAVWETRWLGMEGPSEWGQGEGRSHFLWGVMCLRSTSTKLKLASFY